jgi:hypothetical protein
MGHFLAAFFGKLAADEVKAWLPRIAHYIVRRAVTRLPVELQDRYLEEWQAYVNDVPGDLSKLLEACGFLVASRKLAGKRWQILSRLCATLLLVLFWPAMIVIYVLLKIRARAEEVVTQYHIVIGDHIHRLSIFSVDSSAPWELRLRHCLRESLPLTEAVYRYDRFHYSMLRGNWRLIGDGYLVRSGFFALPMLLDVISGEISMSIFVSELARWDCI